MRSFLASGIALGMAAIPALIGGAAQAQLASQSSQFSGTVPPLCRVTDLVNPTTTMSFLNDKLSGTTNDFSFESNGNIALQLRAVDVVSAPDGTGNYTWAAGLKVNNGAELASATQAGASATVAYPNGLTSNDDFQMTLSVSAPQGQLMRQGTYVAVVTTDCIVN